MTLVARHAHHFLLLAASFGTFVGENLKDKRAFIVCLLTGGRAGHIGVIWTFLFLWAGSDLQSLSMCSPTLMSGISPLFTGMGMLHKGHTGTWISCRKIGTLTGVRCYLRLTGVNHLVLLPLPFCRMRCICDLHMLYDPCRRSPDRRHISLEENLP